MTDDNYGTSIDAATVRFARTLPGPPERVWSYLVEADKRRRWLANGSLEPHVGGRVSLIFRHSELSPPGDIVPDDAPECVELEGRVTAIEPPFLLEHTWPETDGESVVRFELTAVGDSVRLVVTHRRLDSHELKTLVAAGWHVHLDLLVAAVEDPSEEVMFWRRFGEYRRRYDRAFRKP